MNMKRIAPVLLALALGGCGTTAVLEPGSTKTIEPDESLIVLGVNSGYRVALFVGDVTGGQFKKNNWLGPVINGAATDGYIVARARAGQVLGLTGVTAQGEGLFGQTYTACGGARAPVFHVPKGQILYLADIRYEPGGGRSLSIRYEDRLEAAAAFVRKQYPQFRGTLQRARVEALPMAGICQPQTIYVPIYVGR